MLMTSEAAAAMLMTLEAAVAAERAAFFAALPQPESAGLATGLAALA
jgi:hypothetical protein